MSGDDGTITLDEACALLAARLRATGSRTAKIEIRSDGRVEVRIEDGRGFLVRQWRADVSPGWPTDPTPSDAFRIIDREWIPEDEP